MLRHPVRACVLSVIAAFLLLGANGSLPVHAQAGDIETTCSTGAVGLDTCVVVLSNGIPQGDSLTATIASPGATIVGCQSYTPGSSCSISDGVAMLTCPNGCPASSEFQEMVQLYSGETPQQQFNVSGPISIAEPPAPAPQMFSSCLSGVLTDIGCIPSSAYLSYLNCMSSWMQSCSFDLGYGYTGYYFPAAATYAFYLPVGNYYSFYTPSTSNYCAFYSPDEQSFVYWNPPNGFYAVSPAVAIFADADPATEPVATAPNLVMTAPQISQTAAIFLPPWAWQRGHIVTARNPFAGLTSLLQARQAAGTTAPALLPPPQALAAAADPPAGVDSQTSFGTAADSRVRRSGGGSAVEPVPADVMSAPPSAQSGNARRHDSRDEGSTASSVAAPIAAAPVTVDSRQADRPSGPAQRNAQLTPAPAPPLASGWTSASPNQGRTDDVRNHPSPPANMAPAAPAGPPLPSAAAPAAPSGPQNAGPAAQAAPHGGGREPGRH